MNKKLIGTAAVIISLSLVGGIGLVKVSKTLARSNVTVSEKEGKKETDGFEIKVGNSANTVLKEPMNEAGVVVKSAGPAITILNSELPKDGEDYPLLAIIDSLPYEEWESYGKEGWAMYAAYLKDGDQVYTLMFSEEPPSSLYELKDEEKIAELIEGHRSKMAILKEAAFKAGFSPAHPAS
ncbi:hypothetical protein D1B31_02550 [Neobacillus notoginsengisoli]|uniref:Uncharacterized protein n=1 Tax=Neobacillus notoginsengisoli TaxID=1578198 RepID=A0A417Z166_9BACI|nr:hypothetical protein [Neobacillus notoginsengisoli]RHW43551.1 hypothetical protein D1B31_02550 [Neobacillus notoginsengisoli]